MCLLVYVYNKSNIKAISAYGQIAVQMLYKFKVGNTYRI